MGRELLVPYARDLTYCAILSGYSAKRSTAIWTLMDPKTQGASMEKRPIVPIALLLLITLAAIWAYDQRFPDRVPPWLAIFVSVIFGLILVFAAFAELSGENLSDFFRPKRAKSPEQDPVNREPRSNHSQLVELLETAATQMMSANKPLDAIQVWLVAGRMASIRGAGKEAHALFEHAQQEAIQAGLADIERRCSLSLAELQMTNRDYHAASDLAARAIRGPRLSPQRVEALSLHAEALWRNHRIGAALECYQRAAKGFEALAAAERQRRDAWRHELEQAKSYYLRAWDAWHAVAEIAVYRQRQFVEEDNARVEKSRRRLRQIESDALVCYERIGKLVGTVQYQIEETDRVEKEMTDLLG